MVKTEHIKTFLKENLWAIIALCLLIVINLATHLHMGEGGGYFWKNLLWQCLGLLILIIFTFFFDYRRPSLNLLWLLYGFMCLLLILLAIFKKRWLVIGPLSFQPSEFLKIILVYLISLYINKKKELKLEVSEALFLLGVIAFPLLFILPVDLDYAFIIGFMFFTFLLFLGFPKKLFLVLMITGLLFSALTFPIVWNKLKPYQKGRIYGYLDPEKYYKTWGYQLSQSLVAIGSGGITGQGFKKGFITRLNYLPAKNTDLAFSVYAEAFGLVGVSLFLLAYGYLLYFGLTLSKNAKDLLGKSLSLGIVLILLWQTFFNLGGAIGLLPMTSIPQPFLSYGGSITITTYFMLSILFNIAFRKDFFK